MIETRPENLLRMLTFYSYRRTGAHIFGSYLYTLMGIHVPGGVVILVVVERIARQFVDTVESQMPGTRCWVCIGTSVNASSKPVRVYGGRDS